MNPQDNPDQTPANEPDSDNNEKRAESPAPVPADQAPESPYTVQPPAYATQSPVQDMRDPKSRLAMICFAYFAAPLGVARIYLGDKSGLVRFWIYISALVLLFIPGINILSILAIMVLTIWGFVDFFLLRGRKTDHFDQTLLTSDRDERYIRYITIFFFVSISIFALIVIFGLIIIIGGLALYSGNGLDLFRDSYVSPRPI